MARNNNISITSSLVAIPISSLVAPPLVLIRTTIVENSNSVNSSSRSFLIYIIIFLESNTGYFYQKEEIYNQLTFNNLNLFIDIMKVKAFINIYNYDYYNSR